MNMIKGADEPDFRGLLRRIVASDRFANTVTGLIVLNAIILGLETSDAAMQAAGPVLQAIDRALLAIFCAELVLKLAAQGRDFFRQPWNWFDTAVVGIALVPATGPLSVLRALRVLRVLRLLSVVPRMRLVVEALLRSLPGLGSIAGLLLLVYYVFGVMATKLYGADFPEWFGTLGASMYTLFQVMTLESWSMGIVRPVMEVHPEAWMFFVPYILVATFTMLNLFIAIIVNSMQSLAQDVAREQTETAAEEVKTFTHADHMELLGEVRALRAEVRALKGTAGDGG